MVAEWLIILIERENLGIESIVKVICYQKGLSSAWFT